LKLGDIIPIYATIAHGKTRIGRPFGDEVFYDYIKTVSGRNLKPKKARRHKKQVLCPLIYNKI